jgi:hypothetical protein
VKNLRDYWRIESSPFSEKFRRYDTKFLEHQTLLLLPTLNMKSCKDNLKKRSVSLLRTDFPRSSEIHEHATRSLIVSEVPHNLECCSIAKRRSSACWIDMLFGVIRVVL